MSAHSMNQSCGGCRGWKESQATKMLFSPWSCSRKTVILMHKHNLALKGNVWIRPSNNIYRWHVLSSARQQDAWNICIKLAPFSLPQQSSRVAKCVLQQKLCKCNFPTQNGDDRRGCECVCFTQSFRLNLQLSDSQTNSFKWEKMTHRKFLFGVFRLIDVCFSAFSKSVKWSVKCPLGVPVFEKNSSSPWPRLLWWK